MELTISSKKSDYLLLDPEKLEEDLEGEKEDKNDIRGEIFGLIYNSVHGEGFLWRHQCIWCKLRRV